MSRGVYVAVRQTPRPARAARGGPAQAARAAATSNPGHGIDVGGGLGTFAGRAWRIGLMGHSCQERNVRLVLTALERLLAGR